MLFVLKLLNLSFNYKQQVCNREKNVLGSLNMKTNI